MPGKNSVSALRPEGRAILGGQAASEPATEDPRLGGRPKKAPAEKRSYKVTLSLTPEEGAVLEEKCGLVRSATYIYDVLKREGVFDR